MALVPVIQPPIIRLLTTKKERAIRMETPREVSKTEKILFPIVVTVITCLLVPSAAPLIGCLMLGNLIKESGVVPKIRDTLANSLMYIVTILLGVCVGMTADAATFLTLDTILIFGLGIIAFAVATAAGVLGGKLMCVLTKGKVNPMIGAAGVSAVPMAARVVHKWVLTLLVLLAPLLQRVSCSSYLLNKKTQKSKALARNESFFFTNYIKNIAYLLIFFKGVYYAKNKRFCITRIFSFFN